MMPETILTLTAGHRRQLLALARASIESWICGERVLPDIEAAIGELQRAAFVTLRRQQRLRGCLGTLASDRPLRELIAELAVSSATRDPRFPRVRAEELVEIRIEISVLSPAAPAHPDEVEIGTHGLIVERGNRRGLLLPQVATQHRLTRTQFLEATCQKAGLPASAWMEPGIRLRTFTAEVFGEEQ